MCKKEDLFGRPVVWTLTPKVPGGIAKAQAGKRINVSILGRNVGKSKGKTGAPYRYIRLACPSGGPLKRGVGYRGGFDGTVLVVEAHKLGYTATANTSGSGDHIGINIRFAINADGPFLACEPHEYAEVRGQIRIPLSDRMCAALGLMGE